ncbi:MAG TPA: hypothetical protein VII25_06260, partial [Candidatus Acidoferrum sp.]
MSNGIRRIIAIVVLVLGAALLWIARDSVREAESAKSDLDATVAYARERAASHDPRLKGTYRFERGGWVYVHLQGEPAEIGFQHGYMLAP